MLKCMRNFESSLLQKLMCVEGEGVQTLAQLPSPPYIRHLNQSSNYLTMVFFTNPAPKIMATLKSCYI